MGTKRCRVAIAEPNCIITNEQPDAIGFGGYATVLVEAKTSRADFLADLKKPFRIHPKKEWVCIGITYASRESSLLMTCRDFGDYCMFSLAEGFGKSDPAAASLI